MIVEEFNTRIGAATVYYKTSLDNLEVPGFEAGMKKAMEVLEKNVDIFIAHDPRDKGRVWKVGCIAVFSGLILDQKNGEFFSSYANGFNQGLKKAVEIFSQFVSDVLVAP